MTFDYWLSVAVGQIGIAPSEFEQLTPAEFIAAWYGYTERRRRSELAALRAARQEAYLVMSPFCKNMPSSAAKLMPLPGDDDGDDTDSKSEEIDAEALRQTMIETNKIFGE